MREYREQLEGMELGVMEDMGRRWLRIEERLLNDMAALEGQALKAAAEGKVVTRQMIWKMETYKRMKARLEEEIKRYNAEYLIPKVAAEQVRFGMFGVESGAGAINASYGIGIGPWFPVINRDVIEAMAGLLSNGSPLNTLLKEDYPDALEGILDALLNGMARGMGAGEIAKEMAVGMGGGLDRAMLIARTEVNRAYRTATVQQYRESNVVDGFRRLVKKATACAACLMLDGETFKSEDYLDDHPAGKCVAVPNITGMKPAKWETGREYFEKLSPEEQMARLGREKYEAWQAGKFDLGDLARKSESAEWGRNPRVATLKELVGSN